MHSSGLDSLGRVGHPFLSSVNERLFCWKYLPLLIPYVGNVASLTLEFILCKSKWMLFCILGELGQYLGKEPHALTVTLVD